MIECVTVSLSATPAAPYDAIVLLSYGGPYRQQDVLPFLRDVVEGKGVPDERLEVVGAQYRLFGGRSPINDENLALARDLRRALHERGSDVPVLLANRHWHPHTVDTLRDVIAYGGRRVLVVITAAYLSYSGSRQYREHLAAVLDALAAETGVRLQVDVLRAFYNDPGFIDANEQAILDAVAELPQGRPVHVAFVTHSIPETMNDASGATGPTYLEQHRLIAAELDRRLRTRLGERLSGTTLSFCSRSGSPRQPWLEPDVNERLDELASSGQRAVVLAPIGFIADHMEVAFDLDTEASAHARELGLAVARATTAGHRPEFIDALAGLVLERAAVERDPAAPRRPVVGDQPMAPDVAPAGSCRQRDGVVTGIPVIAGDRD